MQAADILMECDAIAPKPGDVLAIGHAGAYASSRACVFNGRLRPAEVLVDGSSHKLVRRAEDVDDLFLRDVLD